MESCNQEFQRLMLSATSARMRAYAPYSGFLVGAAILTKHGQIIEGCNVENASYGLSICAERGAVAAAIVGGLIEWQAIAVASAGAVTPCGACRQVLAEFGGDLDVLLVDTNSGLLKRQFKIAELLPDAFELNP